MHLALVVLLLVLLALCLAIVIMGASLLVRPRRKAELPPAQADEFEDILRTIEARPAPTQDEMPAAPAQEAAPAETEFVFRRTRAQNRPETVEKTASAPSAPPKPIDFDIIQREIRAALGTATQAESPATAGGLSLDWAEPGRLAVLSLGDAEPQAAWPLLQAEGIHILIVAADHPFPTPNRAIDLICLPEDAESAIPALIAGLRAKLAKGGRIAFYTETGLSGPMSLLAARLSSRAMG